MKSSRLNLDALGVIASTLCMIHCLAFPVLLTLIPMWKLSTIEPEKELEQGWLASADSGVMASSNSLDCCTKESAITTKSGFKGSHKPSCCSTPTDFWIHVGLLLAVAPLGLFAWGAGFRQHGQIKILGLGLTGVLLLCGALLFGNLLGGHGEQVMTVTGSICMVSAHLWNRHHCQCCQMTVA